MQHSKALWMKNMVIFSVKLFQNFLVTTRIQKIVGDMLEAYKELGCNMSMKMHFLFSHLDYFPENLGFLSEEHGERFHKDVQEFERRYQGRWSISMLAD